MKQLCHILSLNQLQGSTTADFIHFILGRLMIVSLSIIWVNRFYKICNTTEEIQLILVKTLKVDKMILTLSTLSLLSTFD